nr:serine/threonine protein kinase [Oceanococcus sp. HetDA_MAG_MS8]
MADSSQVSEDEIDRVLDAVIDLPAPQRLQSARRICADNTPLWAAIQPMLELDLDPTQFLQPRSVAARSPTSLPTSSLIGQAIGAWKVVRKLGQGGMGEVFLVERADGQYQMQAALKRLHTADPANSERMQRERQILAALAHPHIAQLLDGGVDDQGHPWMVMELVDGTPLDQWAHGRSQQEILPVFEQVLDAVAYAHSQLVIHRDLKPSNVLVDERGRAKLLDFGIAKLLTALHTADKTQALATPNYAAPEQMLGEPVSTATDVYALGAILYKLLSGHPPLDLEGAPIPVLIDRVQHQIPPSPSSLQPGTMVSPALDAICLKALQKRPVQRYASVTDLRADLDRFRKDFPVLAREPGRWDYFAHFLRRNRLIASAAAGVVMAIFVGLLATSWQARLALQERDVARLELQRMQSLRNAFSEILTNSAERSDPAQTRALFERASTAAEARVAQDPLTAATLWSMLSSQLLHAEDYAGARGILSRVDTLNLRALPPSLQADIALNKAHLSFRDRDLEATAEHIAMVREVYSQAPMIQRHLLLSLATLESQLERARGNEAAAVERLKQGLVHARKYLGDKHPETATLWVNLAVAHYYAGNLGAALHSSEQGYAIYQALGEEQSPDALNLLTNWGAFALRAGRPLEAQQRLSSALDLRSKLYGASAAQAVLLKNLGITHWINGELEDARTLLEQSQWMASRYAGAGSNLHASASCNLARLLYLTDHTAAAAAAVAELPTDFYSTQSIWVNVCQGLQHIIEAPAVAAGPPAPALAAINKLKARGKRGENHAAHLREALAHRLGRQADWAGALTQIELAIEEKSAARAPEHFSIAMLQLKRAEYLERLGQQRVAQQERLDAQTSLRRVLSPTHPLLARSTSP